jgi:hypothetical protein
VRGRTSAGVALPIAQRLTRRSSPPVASTPPDVRPTCRQRTPSACATKSRTFVYAGVGMAAALVPGTPRSPLRPSPGHVAALGAVGELSNNELIATGKLVGWQALAVWRPRAHSAIRPGRIGRRTSLSPVWWLSDSAQALNRSRCGGAGKQLVFKNAAVDILHVSGTLQLPLLAA